MSDPPSLRKTSSFITLLYRINRKYNPDVYEYRRGRHSGYCSVCCVGIACRACGHPFDPIGSYGCFLSHTPRPHGSGLAMADHFACVVCDHDCSCCVRPTGGESTLLPAACFNPDSNRGSFTATNRYGRAIRNADSRTDPDSYCDIHASTPG